MGIWDFEDGDLLFERSGDMAFDSDGHMMVRMSDNMAMDRIQRIQTMEEKLDKAIKAVAALDEALEQFKDVSSDIEELIAYYESDLWRKDFEADEEGLLPADLKRGVLSEDGIYNLMTDYQRLKDLHQYGLRENCEPE